MIASSLQQALQSWLPPLRAAGALDVAPLPDADALDIADTMQVVPKHSTC